MGLLRHSSSYLMRNWRQLLGQPIDVDLANGNMAVHSRHHSGLWGLAYLVAGVIVVCYALVQIPKDAPTAIIFGTVFGFLVAGTGLAWLLPAGKTLLFDTAAKEVRETS